MRSAVARPCRIRSSESVALETAVRTRSFAGEASQTDKGKRVLATARAGVGAGDQDMHVGIAAIAHVVDEGRLVAQVVVVAVRLRAIEKHAHARLLALWRILHSVDGRDESGDEEDRSRTAQWSLYGEAARSVYWRASVVASRRVCGRRSRAQPADQGRISFS